MTPERRAELSETLEAEGDYWLGDPDLLWLLDRADQADTLEFERDTFRDAANGLTDTVEALEAEVKRLRAALRDGIELAEEGWGYAMPYFREKWDVDGRVERLKEALGE